MFTDMSLSRELLERFKASPESAGVNLEQVVHGERSSGIKCSIHVLYSLWVASILAY